MFGHRYHHQQRESAIQRRDWSDRLGEHGDVDRAEGNARDDIRDEGHLLYDL